MAISMPSTATTYSIDGPRLPDPGQEAARQLAIFSSVNLQLGICRNLYADESKNYRKEMTEVMREYRARNSNMQMKLVNFRVENTPDVAQEMADDMRKTKDGFFGSIHRLYIIMTRRDDMIEDIHRKINHMGGGRVDTGLSDDPAYNECFKFMRTAGYGKYDLKMPS